MPQDAEYHISNADGGDTTVTTAANEALVIVGMRCLARGAAVLDIVIFSEEAARAFGGSDAAKRYREDPEASVFERYEFKCNAVGRVP